MGSGTSDFQRLSPPWWWFARRNYTFLGITKTTNVGISSFFSCLGYCILQVWRASVSPTGPHEQLTTDDSGCINYLFGWSLLTPTTVTALNRPRLQILGPFNLYLNFDALFIKAHQYDPPKAIYFWPRFKCKFVWSPQARDHEEPQITSFNMMIPNINRLLRTGISIGTNLQNLDERRIFIGARGNNPCCQRAQSCTKPFWWDQYVRLGYVFS